MWVLLFMWLGQGLDTSVTVYALGHGFTEANPLLPNTRVGVVAVKVGVTTGVHLVVRRLPKRHRWVATIAVGVAGLVPAVINVRRLQARE